MLTDKQEFKLIQECLKEMGNKHFQRAKKKGIALVFTENNSLVYLYPNGTEQILKKIKKQKPIPYIYTIA